MAHVDDLVFSTNNNLHTIGLAVVLFPAEA